MKNKSFAALIIFVIAMLCAVVVVFGQDEKKARSLTYSAYTPGTLSILEFESDTVWMDSIFNFSVRIPVRVKYDTIIKHDTVFTERIVFICPPDSTVVKPKPLKDSLKFTAFGGSFKDFVNQAIIQNKVAVLDSNINLTEPVGVRGDLTLVGYNKPTIISNQRWLWWLYHGKHEFFGIHTIMSAENGNHFYTDPTPGITWTNILTDVTMTGGEVGYLSSRGGNDSTKCITTLTDCDINTGKICISIFSQDGPHKALHLKNTRLRSGWSHNIYAHMNVALDFYETHHLGAGKLGLHHFSALGVPGVAEYIRISKSFTYDDYSPYQFPPGQIAYIDSSDIPLYADGNQTVYATNTNFKKVGGSGAWVVGNSILDNCTGYIMTGNAVIINSQLEELRLRSTGIVDVVNSTIKHVGGGGLNNKFTLLMNATTVDAMAITNIHEESRIRLTNGSSYLPAYSWKPPTWLILQDSLNNVE